MDPAAATSSGQVDVRVVNGRTALLLGACVAGGLILTTMVIGSRDAVVVEATPGSIVPTVVASVPANPTSDTTATSATAAVALPDTTVAEDPVATTAVTSGESFPEVASPPTITPSADVNAQVAASPAVGSTAVTSMALPSPTASSRPAAAPPSESPTAPESVPEPAATSWPVATGPAAAAPGFAAEPPPTVTHPSYTVSGIASVTVWFDGSSLGVDSVITQPDWVSSIDSNGPRAVEIKFFNVHTHAEGELHAAVEDGRVRFESAGGA